MGMETIMHLCGGMNEAGLASSVYTHWQKPFGADSVKNHKDSICIRYINIH
jgi:hypothetical protein